MSVETTYDQVFDAQEHYRLILDSMARPGKINIIPQVSISSPAALNQASGLLAFALLNRDASFCAIAQDEVTTFIALHTAAEIADLEKADFVFIPGLQHKEFMGSLKTGNLSYPEDSATIVADVTEISSSEIAGSLQLRLKGPGIKEIETVYVKGLNPEILNELKEQNLEFPLGIDIILTDIENRLICLPRSTDVTYTLVNEHTNNS